MEVKQADNDAVSRIQVKEEEESHEALPNVRVEEQTGVGPGAWEASLKALLKRFIVQYGSSLHL